MQNFVHEGDVLTVTAPYDLASGAGCLVGKIFGVSCGVYLTGNTAAQIAVKGVFIIPKDVSAATFSQGDNVYWDDSAKKCTNTAASNPLVGQAEAAAIQAATTVQVRLTGQPFVVDASGAGISASAAEINVLDNVTAGTVAASKGVVVNSAKSVDVLQATTALGVGGTGVPGAAVVETMTTKKVIDLADTVATDVLTVTVPNAAHAAFLEIDILGVLGAGGAIGASEAACLAKYQVSLARTAGVAVVPAISSAIGGVKSNVAGGQAITSVIATLSAITGAVSAPQTFTVKVAITRAGAGADNHVAFIAARILNANATGVTIA